MMWGCWKRGKAVSGTLRYCVDLTSQASAGEFDPCIGRDEEVRQVIQILLYELYIV